MLALGASTHAFCRHRIHRIAMHCAYSQPMAGGWLYIMTNRPNGTLYVGVTADLARRIAEHHLGIGSQFTAKYGLKRLVYAEHHPEIVRAIQREKTIKRWRRAWKVRLIRSVNWDWDDLSGTI
jgi:putative endonuclease